MSDDSADAFGPEGRRDFAKMLDLNRSSLTKGLVDEMEARMRDIETAQADLKAIADTAKEQEFTPREILAMKRIARLRLKDKKAEAQVELAALDRIGKLVGFDLFDWADVE